MKRTCMYGAYRDGCAPRRREDAFERFCLRHPYLVGSAFFITWFLADLFMSAL